MDHPNRPYGPVTQTENGNYSGNGRAVTQEATQRPLNARLSILVDRTQSAHIRMNEALEAIAQAIGCSEPTSLNAARDGNNTPRPPEPVPTASIHVTRLENMGDQIAELNFNLAHRIASYLDGGSGVKGG